jgi:hypothetical protein
MIDRVKTNVLKSSTSDEVSERQEQVFGMAQATAKRRSLNGCACLHLCTPETGTLSRHTHFRFKVGVLALGALALLCLAPHFAFAKGPAGLSDSRTVQDPSQASSSNGNSAQGAQATRQQVPNPQPVTSSTEHAVVIPPQISFEDGQLTIIAENSRLSDILTALRTAIGADIDLPVSVARQRIWVRLGPGPARTILRDLLDNTELDYVIQASDTDPDTIRTVLLSQRSKTGEQGAPGSRMARGASRNSLPYENSNSAEVPDQDGSTPAQSAAASSADPAVPPSSADQPTRSVRTPSAPAVADSSLSKPGGTGSAAQMIQQLQSMYQQRRQMQIQQNQKLPSNNNN